MNVWQRASRKGPRRVRDSAGPPAAAALPAGVVDGSRRAAGRGEARPLCTAWQLLSKAERTLTATCPTGGKLWPHKQLVGVLWRLHFGRPGYSRLTIFLRRRAVSQKLQV